VISLRRRTLLHGVANKGGVNKTARLISCPPPDRGRKEETNRSVGRREEEDQASIEEGAINMAVGKIEGGG